VATSTHLVNFTNAASEIRFVIQITICTGSGSFLAGLLVLLNRDDLFSSADGSSTDTC